MERRSRSVERGLRDDRRRGPKPTRPREGVCKPLLQFQWAEAISGQEWKIYRTASRAVRDAGVPFMLGGGFALATK